MFTHGDDQGRLVMSGDVIANNVSWRASDIENGGFEAFLEAEDPDKLGFNQPGSKKTFTIQDVRRAFSKDAMVALYACKGGSDPKQLQQMRRLLGVPVKSFKREVIYKLDKTKAGEIVPTYGVDGGGGPTVSNFHDLDPKLVP
jgi:hypothetical protein